MVTLIPCYLDKKGEHGARTLALAADGLDVLRLRADRGLVAGESDIRGERDGGREGGGCARHCQEELVGPKSRRFVPRLPGGRDLRDPRSELEARRRVVRPRLFLVAVAAKDAE